MGPRIPFLLLLLSITAALLAVASAAGNSHVQQSTLAIKDATRRIDVSRNAPRVTLDLEVENIGSKEVSDFILAFPASVASNIAFLEASTSNGKKLSTSELFDDASNADSKFVKVALDKSLRASESSKLSIRFVQVNVLRPFPAEIGQSDNQFMLYEDSHFLYSPYEVRSQKTEVKLGTSTVEEYTKNEKPARLSGETITYGPYKNTVRPAFAWSPLRVHYQNNFPQITVSSLRREVEVSHWGNVAIEEHYEVHHTGAHLRGQFSRLDFQRNPGQSAPSHFRTLTAILPSYASDIYFRDEIGNISSSDCRVGSRSGTLEVDFLPRFPLFGGWKTKFYIGYNLPLSEQVKTAEDGRNVLSIKWASPFEAAIVENLHMSIILPEGTSDIHVQSAFPVESQSETLRQTYLDTTGRPVIVIEKKNVVLEHSSIPLRVLYNFGGLGMWREPLLLSAFVFAIFASAIIISRLPSSPWSVKGKNAAAVAAAAAQQKKKL